MPVTIFHDPFKTLIGVFEKQHPDKSCEVVFGADVGPDGFGVTIFPEDGTIPQIAISFELPYQHCVEILAHELAHVAVGEAEDHGQAWEAAFEQLHAGYNQAMQEQPK